MLYTKEQIDSEFGSLINKYSADGWRFATRFDFDPYVELLVSARDTAKNVIVMLRDSNVCVISTEDSYTGNPTTWKTKSPMDSIKCRSIRADENGRCTYRQDFYSIGCNNMFPSVYSDDFEHAMECLTKRKQRATLRNSDPESTNLLVKNADKNKALIDIAFRVVARKVEPPMKIKRILRHKNTNGKGKIFSIIYSVPYDSFLHELWI